MIAALLLALAPHAGAEAAIEAKDGRARMLDFRDAVEVNIRPECRAELVPILAAIRHAENGPAGREYGILHPRVGPTYRSQAGWAAASCQKAWDRWQRAGAKGCFVDFMGARYCPPGDHPLNRNWAPNVRHWRDRIAGYTYVQK